MDNPSIRIALSSYLHKEAMSANLVNPPEYTTPVKCNIKLRNRQYQAIIDSGAAISMIAHETVKELGLTIEHASTNLIITAAGTSTRPLGVIKDLPVEIEGVTIPITVEVVPATSYSLLLGNDWSRKIDANYNWKNSCYSFKWNGKKFAIPTTYESNHTLPAQPTITDPAELDIYEQEFLIPHETYAFETYPDQPETDNDGWTEYHHRSHRQRNNRRVCGNCQSPGHLFANCPANTCNRCKQLGHIAINCIRQTPQRSSCKTCNSVSHLYRQCPQNTCNDCWEQGHIAVDCPLAPLKLNNKSLQCGCNPDDIESRRSVYYSHKRTHHCCECKDPQRPETLKLLNQTLVCSGCYKDFHQELDQKDPRSIHYYTQGNGRGMLVNYKICNKSEPKNRMHNLENSIEDLWFCDLEHMYAYKAASDILYNPNYNLWTRIKHYTESTRSAGSYYHLNQTKVFRLAKVYLQETDLTLQEALEPQTTDRFNQSWNDEEISIILRAEQAIELTDLEEQMLQQVLAESFDISHPEFDHRLALANLRRNFEHPVDLCKECLHVKHQEELDQNNGYCEECAPSPIPIYVPPTPELSPTSPTIPPTPTCELSPNYNRLIDSPPPTPTIEVTSPPDQTDIVNELRQRIEQQDQLILQLFNRVDTLEVTNRNLVQFLQQDAQDRQQRLEQYNARLDELNF